MKEQFTIVIIFFIFLTFFALPFQVDAGVIFKPPNNLGLLGYWPFEEGSGTETGDMSGRGNTGTLSGTAPTWIKGVRGGALEFDGANNSVGLNNNADMSLSDGEDLTITVWVRREGGGAGSTNGIVSDGFSTTVGYHLAHRVPSGNVFQAKVEDTDGDVATATGVTAMPLGEWIFGAMTWDDSLGEVCVYTNGVQENCDTDALIEDTSNSNSSQIGRTINTAYFQGGVDEVRMYNYPLTESEIMAVYEGGKTRVGISRQLPEITGLVGWWTFDGGHMDNGVEDASGNGNTAVIGGQSATTTIIGRVGQALSFDGSDDWVNLGTNFSALVTDTTKTLSAWVKPTVATFGTRARIVRLARDGNNSSAFSISVNTAGNFEYIYDPVSGGNVIDSGIAHGTDWHHVVLVQNGSDINIYVDTVAGTSVNNAEATINGTPQNATIGSTLGSGTPSEFWNGVIDDVRIYDRPLTFPEVVRLYNATRPSTIISQI